MKTKSEAAEPGTSKENWKKEDLELACKIHALARLVRGQLAATQAWVAAAPPSVPSAALPFPSALPGSFPGAWTIPAVWPSCP
jgi:hypothetical protein